MPFDISPKVLFVCPSLNVGGTERHLVRISIPLRHAGIEAGVFVFARGGTLEQELTAAGVPVFGSAATGSRLRRAVQGGWALYRHLRRDPPRIVHFFLAEAYLVGMAAAIAAGIKTRIMSRRSLAVYQRAHPILARIERWLHRGTNALLGNSKAVVEELVKESADASKVGLIHNGIELRSLASVNARAAIRVKLGIPDDAFVIVVVANLFAYKGHGDLLDALAMIDDQMPDPWRLVLIGRDEGMGARLRAQAKSLGLSDSILWLGERMDADRLIGAADVSVLCSHEEGFSNSVIEAMAAGLPMIATDIGGNRDAVVRDETGLLVPAKSPKHLALAILKLAGDRDLRADFGKAGRRRVERCFSLEVCVGRYISLYRNVSMLGQMAVQDILEQADEAGPHVPHSVLHD